MGQKSTGQRQSASEPENLDEFLSERQGALVDAVIDRLASGQSLAYYEIEVIRWLAQILGLPRL